MALKKIISGGQTGVDRGALDAALNAGFPCGGWCPPRRLAGDGMIPERYPLREMSQGGYRQRMIQNLLDGDGTLIIYFGRPEGGTEQTLAQCIKKRRPYLLIDGAEVGVARAAELTARFIEQEAIETINVAGPSGHKAPRGEAYARDTVAALLRLGKG